MQITSPLFGASRLRLTTKRGPKHWYKGTGQSRLPNSAARTGPPGRHIVRGSGNYQLLDDKVRVYVAPPPEVLDSTSLKPYVSTSVKQTFPLQLPKFGLPGRVVSQGALKRVNGPNAISLDKKEELKMEARRKWFAAFSNQAVRLKRQQDNGRTESGNS